VAAVSPHVISTVGRLRCNMKRLLPIVLLLAFSITACDIFDKEERRVTDDAFIMMEDIVSPDRQHRILVYQYDTGAFGYSRVWWAVTPNEYRDLNLMRIKG